MTGITVLGSTGSIGVSTLGVIEQNSERYRVVALTANRQVARMLQQCLQHRPSYAVMVDEASAEQLRDQLIQAGSDTEVLCGVDGLITVASLAETDQVMAAIVGSAGLPPTLAAARAGKRILLANKEALVMTGKLFMDEVAVNQAELLPIDSEHNAIFQSLPNTFNRSLSGVGVRRILLTASGGPFRETEVADLAGVTPAQAVAHPNWSMGRKISVDSATMMNKGLELIEACWLFHTSPDNIQVVIHPQSVIHSLVQYIDGSVIAELGNPDMRTPIAHAMAWPERMESGVADLDLFEVAQLDFSEPDLQRFPSLRLAREAMESGGTMPAVLNAANEIAVEAFLNEQIRFTSIAEIIEQTLSHSSRQDADTLDVVFAADSSARAIATELVARGGF